MTLKFRVVEMDLRVLAANSFNNNNKNNRHKATPMSVFFRYTYTFKIVRLVCCCCCWCYCWCCCLSCFCPTDFLNFIVAAKRGLPTVWPDWAIYWTLGNFLKPLATIKLPKSSTFLGNFCKGVTIFNFSNEIIFGQLL